ncbi:hypothetical protein EXU28_09285 [Acinetobacter wuhouensis]|uniref:Uncharacterized protein n=1 Tax=Acinetobacter wuhouensis TaxID=1879050 RepID=A0A4Q7AG94_9GAMM|nr:hypothetical protein EXU28_09285 [Acinetobacter wuhouensis]
MRILRLVLNKNFISCFLVLGASLVTSFTYADDEIKLKKSCIKDYPVVAGETSPELLSIYAQVCDKKNKDNKDMLLVSAAEKFQQLGKNDKALQLVNFLEGQNIQSTTLTDVKFLAGISLAKDALNKMINTEVRYLTEDKTYPVAKSFVDAVKSAAPAAILVEKQESQASSVTKTTKPAKVKPAKTLRPTTPTRAVTTVAPSVKPPKAQPATSAPKNPFGDLK